jgi:hypothetical protein
LELEADNGEKFVVKVCGSCWDVVAGIAVKALMAPETLKQLLSNETFYQELLKKISVSLGLPYGNVLEVKDGID